jgi:hypothetical protein
VTTFDPGARLLFTHGLRVKPFSTAFLARRPAAISTLGLEVLVQLVIAVMTTAPWSSASTIGSATATAVAVAAPFAFAGCCMVGRAVAKAALARDSATRSCGRFGPARLGSIVARLTSIVSE